MNRIKDKLSGFFWDFVINLIDTLLERKERSVFHRQFGRLRKPAKSTRFDFHGHFFWANLPKDEMLVDFSKIQHGIDCAFVPVRKGRYRLERKMVRFGNGRATSWLFLRGAIGARESWWQKKNAEGQLSLKLDADI